MQKALEGVSPVELLWGIECMLKVKRFMSRNV